MVRLLLKRICSDASGFTMIELVMTSVILLIISAPIAAILMAAAAENRSARDDTAASQLLQTQVEAVHALPYTQVGVANGNPPGALQASTSSTLANGTQVTVGMSVVFVNDPIPTAYVTNADYKRVTITITRNSDSKVLASNSIVVSAASAPPYAGTNWVQIKRTVVDAVTLSPIGGGSIGISGGPSGTASRTDTTDGSGTVLFPALDNTTSGSPSYTVTPTLSGAFSGYSVFPDDLAPQSPTQVSSAAGTNSIANLRLYQPATLTVNLQSSTGTKYTGAATVSVESTRCGVAAQGVTSPNASGSVVFTTCSYANGKTVPFVPNVAGQTPSFDKYTVTIWNGSTYGWSSAFTVPASYPTNLQQSVNVKFNTTTYTSLKTFNVTVKKSGSNDTQARVYVTCTAGPASGIALYGLTNSSGVATFQIPTNATGNNCTVAANDQGAVSGSWTTPSTALWTASTTSPIAVTVNES
jgi:prepilin-type N-terminal cleavage/methylation domain-containing protein